VAPRRIPVGPEGAGKRLDQFLAESLPAMTLDRARELIASGSVRIRGKRPKPLRRLWGGEEVEVELRAPGALAKEQGPQVPILAESPDWLVVDKPAGIVVEPSDGSPSVVGLLASQRGGFDAGGIAAPGVVHRLDRETSGCLALAKTDEGMALLEAAFREKRVDKRYLAIVLGAPPDSESIDTPYARDPSNPRRYTTRVASPRRARLSYQVRERFPGAALVEVKLDTGRTHQIRAQLSERGFPVLADPLYGPDEAKAHPAAKELGRLALHSARLAFEGLPPGARTACEAPIPADFARALSLLRR